MREKMTTRRQAPVGAPWLGSQKRILGLLHGSRRHIRMATSAAPSGKLWGETEVHGNRVSTQMMVNGGGLKPGKGSSLDTGLRLDVVHALWSPSRQRRRVGGCQHMWATKWPMGGRLGRDSTVIAVSWASEDVTLHGVLALA
jgi:hypothetical protein